MSTLSWRAMDDQRSVWSSSCPLAAGCGWEEEVEAVGGGEESELSSASVGGLTSIMHALVSRVRNSSAQ